MNRTIITFIIFLTAQVFLWLVSISENIIADDEILALTAALGVPLALFFWRFRWMRWVASVLLFLMTLLVGSMTLEGFGTSFLVIGLLYILIIYLIFSHRHERIENIADKPANEPVEQVYDTAANQVDESIPNGFYFNDTVYHYPLLVKRYQSLLIDFVLMFAVMIVVMITMGESDIRQYVMLALGGFFVFIYEPLLTAFNATVGQHIVGIRVRQMQNPEQRIGLMNAYLRAITKFLLGWLSFLTISFNPQHRAIHDFASSSVVIVKQDRAAL